MNKEIEKDVINCSRCGLCMDVCPVYKVKKTETSLLRGKFLQLLGLIKGDLKYDSKISYNIDLCLSCNKCKKACPSGIDAVSVFSHVRGEYQSIFEHVFYSAPFLKLKMLVLKIFYKVKYPFGRKKPKFPNEQNIGYFKGCVTSAINTGFNKKNDGFNCCGLPFYIKGRFDLYEKYKKRNLALISKFDKIVFDCATCYDTVSNYEGVNKEKLVYFTDFYKNLKLKAPKKTVLTFHKPCHLDEEKFKEIEEILKSIENVEYVKMEKYDDCCGFGGDFFTRHFKTASTLSVRKIENAIKTGANTIITTCPTCLWSLKFGIKAKKANLKAFDLVEFLDLCKN